MTALLAGAVATIFGTGAFADDFAADWGGDGSPSKLCAGLPSQAALKSALTMAR
jgi:hypothetical protein